MVNFTKGKKMNKYAIVEDGIVTNIIVAESKEIAEEATEKTCVQYEDTPAGNHAHIGLKYDAETELFEQPNPYINPDIKE